MNKKYKKLEGDLEMVKAVLRKVPDAIDYIFHELSVLKEKVEKLEKDFGELPDACPFEDGCYEHFEETRAPPGR